MPIEQVVAEQDLPQPANPSSVDATELPVEQDADKNSQVVAGNHWPGTLRGQVQALASFESQVAAGDPLPGKLADDRLAAGQGDVHAQYNLGLMYANGTGVPQDYNEAAKWFRLAAEQGHASAQYNLHAINEKRLKQKQVQEQDIPINALPSEFHGFWAYDCKFALEFPPSDGNITIGRNNIYQHEEPCTVKKVSGSRNKLLADLNCSDHGDSFQKTIELELIADSKLSVNYQESGSVGPTIYSLCKK